MTIEEICAVIAVVLTVLGSAAVAVVWFVRLIVAMRDGVQRIECTLQCHVAEDARCEADRKETREHVHQIDGRVTRIEAALS